MPHTETASSVSSLASSIDEDDADSSGKTSVDVFDGGFSVGELLVLAEDLEPKGDQSTPSSSVASSDLDTDNKKSHDLPKALSSINSEAQYGQPLSPDEAKRVLPSGEDGLLRHAIVIPDNFCQRGKLVGGLNKKDFDLKTGSIKPRRASLPLTQSQLFSSLTVVPGQEGKRYIFNGILNGWPSLRNFELVALEKKRSLGPLTPPDYLNSMRHTWSHYWSVDKEGRNGISPAIKDKSKIYRVKLRGAPWTATGWSPDSPGFFFWYQAQSATPKVSYGLKSIQEVGDDRCTMVHMISHRYAVKNESPKDRLTYHSIGLLEWEHGNFCTVVEGAYLNGIGGYKGRSNWYHDRDESITSLYKALPAEMISPWLTKAAEIRCYDVDVKSLDEMKAFIAKYEGPDHRFIDPHYTFSHPARLTYRSRSHIAQYLVNYVSRDCSYSELTRNCQTFTADICGFLAGKKDVVPYHPLNRIDYHNRTHFFLYDSAMYDNRKKSHLKGKIAK